MISDNQKSEYFKSLNISSSHEDVFPPPESIFHAAHQKSSTFFWKKKRIESLCWVWWYQKNKGLPSSKCEPSFSNKILFFPQLKTFHVVFWGCFQCFLHLQADVLLFFVTASEIQPNFLEKWVENSTQTPRTLLQCVVFCVQGLRISCLTVCEPRTQRMTHCTTQWVKFTYLTVQCRIPSIIPHNALQILLK